MTPAWGQWLSMTLRDCRVLRDQLLRKNNWDDAGHAYAEEKHKYFSVTHTIENWIDELMNNPGSKGDELRSRVLPAWADDPTRKTDVLLSGPDIEITDNVRRRFFVED